MSEMAKEEQINSLSMNQTSDQEEDGYRRRLSGPLNSHPPASSNGRPLSASTSDNFANPQKSPIPSDSDQPGSSESDSDEDIAFMHGSPVSSNSHLHFSATHHDQSHVGQAPDSATVDIMNDPLFDPISSTTQNGWNKDITATENNTMSSERSDTCRICRSEGTHDEPLFYPCKCSGSIKFVHQECLMEWLAHSNKKHCELCKTAFHFTKLYDASMPSVLPWNIFLQRACLHVLEVIGRICRFGLVACIWMVILPWFIRWAWRWMFWLIDAGWAREKYFRYAQEILAANDPRSSPTPVSSSTNSTGTSFAFLYNLATRLSQNNLWDFTSSGNSSTAASDKTSNTPPDTSILSSWTYISHLTPSANINRVILDVFEGQIITCFVIAGFILIFLIREWVVQQQPLRQAFADAVARRRQLENRLRDAQVQTQHARLEETLQRYEELTSTHVTRPKPEVASAKTRAIPIPTWEGFDALDSAMDVANTRLKECSETDINPFLIEVGPVARQVWAAQAIGVDEQTLSDFVHDKVESFNCSDTEKDHWDVVMKAIYDDKKQRIVRGLAGRDAENPAGADEQIEDVPFANGMAAENHGEPSRSHTTWSNREQASHQLQASGSGTSDDSLRLVARVENPGAGAQIAPVDVPKVEVQREFKLTEDQNKRTAAATDPKILQLVDHMTGSASEGELAQADDLPVINSGPKAKLKIRRSPLNENTVIPSPKGCGGPSASRNQQNPDESSPELQPQFENNGNSIEREHSARRDSSESEQPDDGTIREVLTNILQEELNIEGLVGEHSSDAPEMNDVPTSSGTSDNSEVQQVRADHNAAGFERIVNWFWGDLETQAVEQPQATNPDEGRVAENDNARGVRFAPPANDEVAPIAVQPGLGEAIEPDQDQPVIAAAAEPPPADPAAGLDEDAEDLEGVMELIGLQGPLLGLLQTSTFCTILVITTVAGAIGLPYIFGKCLLNFLAYPVLFTITLPLQFASYIADLSIDIGLYVFGWFLLILAQSLGSLAMAMIRWPGISSAVTLFERLSSFAAWSVESSSGRLLSWLPVVQASSDNDVRDSFLAASMHAHGSLTSIKTGVGSALGFLANTVTSIVNLSSSGSVLSILQAGLSMMRSTIEYLWQIIAPSGSFKALSRFFGSFFHNISTGILVIPSSQVSLDPALVYWSAVDRSLAVMAGYLTLAALAAIYVAVDTPLTSSESGQRTERLIRDSLRQAGGVLKVILIISIEMLVFPLYCGMLLDLAFLPLFQDVSIATRWSFACNKPYVFCFVHWFLGTCYMFHFALFVGMCRKILRKGVLWFIRDPDDPTFHPVRDVLERNVSTQLRKIAFSALVYGALVILCLGGVIWTVGNVFQGIFPVYWRSTEPVLEFPLDLMLFSALTPLVIRLLRPSKLINIIYTWWLKRCAGYLRLSHFLFDDRQEVQEGHFVRKTWAAFLLRRTVDVTGPAPESSDVIFERDGRFVMTPCNDQYRPPESGDALLLIGQDQAWVVDKDMKTNDHFARIYTPPSFRLRIAAFMGFLWLFSAFAGLSATLLPLSLGRWMLGIFIPTSLRVNDIYAYSLGASTLATMGYVAFYLHSSMSLGMFTLAPRIRFAAKLVQIRRIAFQVLKCVYVLGSVGIVLPLLVGLLLQFYLFIPLHTYLSSPDMANAAMLSQNSTLTAKMANTTQPVQSSQSVVIASSGPVFHSVHVFQDYCLGLLYARLLTRLFSNSTRSRAAQIFRRITPRGIFDPNVKLATRFVIAPALLVGVSALLFPPATAALSMVFLSAVTTEDLSMAEQTRIYRYSYPMAMSWLIVILAFRILTKAAGRWRARIRDEVYLKGERLHNFGEKQPAKGGRMIVRK